MQSLWVKIIRATRPSLWYADKGGEVFEVYYHHDEYTVKVDDDAGEDRPRRHILTDDCVKISLPALVRQAKGRRAALRRTMGELTEARENTEALVVVCQRILERDTLAGMRQKLRDAIKAIEGEGDE